MKAGRHGFIIVAIVLLPLLATVVTQLKWTADESVPERLGRMATFSAVMLVGLDIALCIAMLENQAC